MFFSAYETKFHSPLTITHLYLNFYGFHTDWMHLVFVSIKRNINLFPHATFHISLLHTFDYKGLAAVQLSNLEFKV